jgi:hypothetical protein
VIAKSQFLLKLRRGLLESQSNMSLPIAVLDHKPINVSPRRALDVESESIQLWSCEGPRISPFPYHLHAHELIYEQKMNGDIHSSIDCTV